VSSAVRTLMMKNCIARPRRCIRRGQLLLPAQAEAEAEAAAEAAVRAGLHPVALFLLINSS